MDKEAQEKIARKLLTIPKLDTEDYDKLWAWVQEAMRENAQQIIDILEERGYRKLPKDKPPLLSKVEISRAIKNKKSKKPIGISATTDELLSAVIQTQWDIWDKAIYGERR